MSVTSRNERDNFGMSRTKNVIENPCFTKVPVGGTEIFTMVYLLNKKYKNVFGSGESHCGKAGDEIVFSGMNPTCTS